MCNKNFNLKKKKKQKLQVQSESSSSSPWSDLKSKDGTTKFATKYIEIIATLTRRKVVISPDSDGGTTLAFGFNLSPSFG